MELNRVISPWKSISYSLLLVFRVSLNDFLECFHPVLHAIS